MQLCEQPASKVMSSPLLQPVEEDAPASTSEIVERFSSSSTCVASAPIPDLEAANESAAETTQPAASGVIWRQAICSCLINFTACILGVLLCSLIFVIGLALLIVCSPCLIIFRARQGRTVSLDGTQLPAVNDATREVIEQVQTSQFHARLDSFSYSDSVPGQVAQLGRSFRTVSRRLAGASFIAEEADAEGARGVGQIREQLIEARRRTCQSNSQKLPGVLQINVAREHVVQQSLQCLSSVPYIDLLAKRLRVSFQNEEGIDVGGVARDWFDSIGRKLVEAAESDDGQLMVLPDRTIAPRPHEGRLTDLYAIGRVAGLAVWFGIALPIPLSTVACKFMLDAPIGPQDIQRLDPDFYQFRVEPVLVPGGVEQLEEALGDPLMFMSAASELREPKELCDGGAEKRVTEENKQEYIMLLCEHYLCGDMRDQIKVLLQGFWDICPKDDLISVGLTHRELALLISGYSTLDPSEWRCNTLFEDGEVIEWFWDMVVDMSSEERATLLHFATGSSRLPSAGFSAVSPKFNISVSGDEVEHLPHAHTCGNQLVLPKYTSKEQLREKMTIALANDEGFGFL